MRLELLRALTDRTVRRVDRVFLLSTQAFDLIGRDVLGDRAEVIPMAPPSIPDVLPPIPDRPDAPFFFFSSDLVRYKGLETAIEALARLDGRDPPFLLVSGRAVESDYAAAMKQLAIRLGVERQVRFLGATPHDLVLALMRESVACVIPSRFENPGRVPVEAMATGAPILASDVPAFREACGDAAAYFPFGHAGELAGMMGDLLRRPSLRGPMIEAGLARIAGMVPSSASEQMLSSLDTLVAEKLVSPASRAAS
jgi:D-inositol-3-phosphate glycosyltransferase